MAWSMEFRVNGKITSEGTRGCFKGRWPSGDNLFPLQTRLCDFVLPVHGPAEAVVDLVTPDLLLAGPPLKQL